MISAVVFRRSDNTIPDFRVYCRLTVTNFGFVVDFPENITANSLSFYSRVSLLYLRRTLNVNTTSGSILFVTSTKETITSGNDSWLWF